MVRRLAAALETRASGRDVVRIVEPDESRATWRVQGEGVGQAVWPFRRHRLPNDLKLEPVASFQVMNTAVERQQELKSMIRPRTNHITR